MQEKYFGIYDNAIQEHVSIRQSNGTFKSSWKTANGAITALVNDLHKAGLTKKRAQEDVAQYLEDGMLEIISFVVVPEAEYNEMKQCADAMKMIRDMMEASKRAHDQERPLPPAPPSVPYPHPYPDCPPWQPAP